MGAMALYNGYLTEMATGEGKSLTACLPAVLAAWTGRPFHFVTVNDYLAERDAVEMRPFYTFCGVTVSSILSQMTPRERRLHYEKEVVYTTLKELVADFLRDRLILGHLHHPSRRLLRQMLQSRVRELDGVVLRGLDTVIVDEADSVLIDEAVTPLIISRAEENKPLMEACRNAYAIACTLEFGTDYQKDLKYREINLTKQGEKRIEEQANLMPGLWRGPSRRTELVQQAITAREFYTRDKEYVIQDGKVTIVDEFTGRLMPNRTWRHGLHQAVEAKEGMTGTAQEATKEFWHIYRLPVLTIPTNRHCIRNVLPDSYFADEESKWNAIVEEIVRFNQTGRPLLVGTRSVKASEKLAERLNEKGLQFNLLNAVRHKEEAQIVAAAGEQGRITIATNMAGRGTDIKLGRSVAELGGLHVMATERHESGRIDRQLFGRSARQGDPGGAQAFMSVEDELIRRFVPAALRNRLASALRTHAPGASRLGEAALFYAQRAAERLAYRQRRNVLQQDTWLEEALSFSGPGGEF
jgi:preprotein translocase subunit SecA